MILSGMALEFVENTEDEFHRKLYEVSRILYEVKEAVNQNKILISER